VGNSNYIASSGTYSQSVNTATTKLTVLGSDDGGESNLTYTWSLISGPVSVSFSANGTNASKLSWATFTQTGTYNIQVVATDAGGLTATSSVIVVAE